MEPEDSPELPSISKRLSPPPSPLPPPSPSPPPNEASAGPADTPLQEMDFDELLSSLGEFGRFQLVVFILVSLGVLAEAVFVFVFVFVAAVPDHWCASPDLDRFNLSAATQRDLTVPPEGDGHEACWMYAVDYSGWTERDVERALEEMWARNGTASNGTGVERCRSGWVYDRSVFSSTIATEWDLVCDKAWMTSFGYTVVGIGQLVGAAFWGLVIDRFGRRRPYYLSLALMIGGALVVSFSPNYPFYCVAQFIMAVNSVACFALGITLAVEFAGVPWRGHLATAVNYFWTLGFMLLAGVAYALRDWSMLQLAVSAPSAVLLLGFFFVPESPRWLYAQGRRAEADDVMARLARFNDVTLPRNVRITCRGDDPAETKVSILSLCRTNRVRLFSFLLGFNWFANALIYYGISLLLPQTSADIYLSFLVSGAVEVPGYALAQISLAYAGRRWPLCATMLVGGVALLCTMAVPEDTEWLRLTLALIGKLCVTASWAIAICFTAELFPTVIRGAGMFVCTLCGNAGNALAPQVGLLSTYNAYVPFVIFGALSVSAGASSLVLPETKDRHLTDTIQQAERAGASQPAAHKERTMTARSRASGDVVSGYTGGTYTARPGEL